MKKTMAILCAAAMLCGATACSGDKNEILCFIIFSRHILIPAQSAQCSDSLNRVFSVFAQICIKALASYT